MRLDPVIVKDDEVGSLRAVKNTVHTDTRNPTGINPCKIIGFAC